MGLFSSTRQPHTRCALRCTAAGRQRGGSGVEGTGVEWSGGEGREGEGRAGQGRVPDCLGGLSRVGISSRSTRPWNGQPPSVYEKYCSIVHNKKTAHDWNKLDNDTNNSTIVPQFRNSFWASQQQQTPSRQTSRSLET